MWFFQQVRSGAVWDIKLENRWKAALLNVPYLKNEDTGTTDSEFGAFLFRGEKRTAEDMGNILYGYAGHAMRFGDITLYWGGGVAAQGGMNNEAVNTPPNYGDDENDHKAISDGIGMFKNDYPDYPEPAFDGIPVEEGLLAAVADALLGAV